MRNYVKKNDKIIEFGPLNKPLFYKNEFSGIKYADIRSTESIKELYKGNDYLKKTGIQVDVTQIVDIDYVVHDSYKKTFLGEKFDIVYLSHVIEHIPNILYFFEDVSNILNKNGKLIIIYPDKRYCFDHFRNSASFRDAYATYKYGLKENARLTFDFAYNVVCENDAKKFWNDNKLSKFLSKNTIEDAQKNYEATLNDEIIDDVHIWPFSDFDFLKFIYEAQRSNLFPFKVEQFFSTQENSQEFMIILTKSSNQNHDFTIKNLLDKYNPNIINNKLLDKEKLEIELLNKRINELDIKINKQEELNRELINENNQLKYLIQRIENSKSMKITLPLRKLSKLIKRSIGKNEKK